MEYREVKNEEIEQVAKLHNELVYFIQAATKDEYWDFDILTLEIISVHMREFVDHPEQRIFIAKENDIIVGFIAGELMECHLPISSTKQVGYITGAYVLNEYRGLGIMKTLEHLMAKFFRDIGVKYVEVTFLTKNQIARECWNKLGYEVFREQARKKIETLI